jgi:hypothetical protein
MAGFSNSPLHEPPRIRCVKAQETGEGAAIVQRWDAVAVIRRNELINRTTKEIAVAQPTKSGPHSDIKGADRGLRAGKPNTDVKKGTAKDIETAERESHGRPANSGKMASGRSG